MQSGSKLLLLVAGIVLSTGCRRAERAHDRAVQPALGSSRPQADRDFGAKAARSPLSPKQLPTTAGVIAVDNLSAQIASSEQLATRDPKNPELTSSLITLISARGRYLGRIADYERAAEMAEQAVRAHPKRPELYVVRSSTRATLHRFDDALADLAEAERLGIPTDDRLDGQRATILQALGRYTEALAIRHRLSEKRPDLQTLGAEAALLSERADPTRGDLDAAERLFEEAPMHFADVSPFPVAWLWLNHAALEEKRDHPARARELLEAARQRVPAYAHVVLHLAPLETPERASQLLNPLLATSDDPEVMAQLSSALERLGKKREADSFRSRAVERYRDLVARHPEAFADHAARFWLGPGKDPNVALSLAERNLSVRKTSAAYELVLEAALVARAAAAACANADAALAATEWRPSRLLRTLCSSAYVECGQREKAKTALSGP